MGKSAMFHINLCMEGSQRYRLHKVGIIFTTVSVSKVGSCLVMGLTGRRLEAQAHHQMDVSYVNTTAEGQARSLHCHHITEGRPSPSHAVMWPVDLDIPLQHTGPVFVANCFTVSLHRPHARQMQGDCQWPFNSRNSHRSCMGAHDAL